MPWQALMHGTLEAAIARVLALDPDTPARLAPLAGKVFALELTDLAQTLYFLFHETGIDVLGEFDGQPEARISGPLAALAKLASAAQKPGGVLGSGVQFAGDVAAAQAFQQFFAELSIDWEEQLALRTGDVFARQAGNAARALFGFARRTADTARANLSEYLQEEARLSPVAEEVESFTEAVDELQSDLARLEARVRRLGPTTR